MNCQDVQRDIDEFLDGTLPESAHSAMAAHIEECEECRQVLEQTRRLRSTLAALPAPAPRPGFARAALRQTRRAHQQPRRGAAGWFAAGFGSAAAAGLASWLVRAPALPCPGPNPVPNQAGASVAMVELAPGTTRSVRLAFDAPQRMEGARLTMRLPEDFELAGHPERREISWITELEAGRNLLELPVRALADGEGELVAEITHGETTKRFRIRLRTGEPAAFLEPHAARPA